PRFCSKTLHNFPLVSECLLIILLHTVCVIFVFMHLISIMIVNCNLQIHRLVFVLRLGICALVLLLKFSPLLILYPLTLLSQRWVSHWLDALLWVTETSGPTFIKLGQWASTRRDIFSRDFCERFSRLHVRVKPHPWSHTKLCLRRAFGEGWRQMFVFDGKEPVGLGCVAQVYRAKAKVKSVEGLEFQKLVEELEKNNLLEAWEDLFLKFKSTFLKNPDQSSFILYLVKKKQWCSGSNCVFYYHHYSLESFSFHQVLHPGIRQQVQIDLILLKAGSLFLNCLPGIKWLSLPEIVDEFEKLMTRQIDLRFEAQNIEKFQKNFKDLQYVKFPTPLRPFVTRTVLVETYEESEPISKYLSSDVPEGIKQRIARMGVDLLLKMVSYRNHSPSLGSIAEQVIMRPTPPLQLVLLDAGIVAQSPNMCLCCQGERVAELILHHARANECQDVTRFKKEMAELVDHALRDTLSLGKVRSYLLSRVFGLLIHLKVRLESNFASMVFAIMVLEGLGRSLDPSLDILEIAKPLLLKNLL
uniref:AarF domain containing kinase 2 n=1 Tax=Sinocyclocheilus rhinocerous TaxID=307959 RepID=A0A673K1T2_9TELE